MLADFLSGKLTKWIMGALAGALLLFVIDLWFFKPTRVALEDVRTERKAYDTLRSGVDELESKYKDRVVSLEGEKEALQDEVEQEKKGASAKSLEALFKEISRTGDTNETIIMDSNFSIYDFRF